MPEEQDPSLAEGWRRRRVAWFAGPAAIFAGLLAWAFLGLPGFGHYRGPYGYLINARVVAERHITDAVTAVNFDYRGFDTLEEEFIIFVSVVGARVLLRPQKGESRKPGAGEAGAARQAPPSGDAVRLLGLGFVGPLVLFGIYIVVHGQLTPGGGFQGGVILASALWMVYLVGGPEFARAVDPHRLVEAAEAAGAAGYALIGFSAFFVLAPFLTNWLGLGKVGSVFSGGTVALIDLAVGLEVAASVSILVDAFMEEALMVHR